MNTAIRNSIIGLALAAGSLALAQTTPGQPSPASEAPAAENAAKPATLQMVPAQAVLDKSLDTKKAKQGDPINAKLQQEVKGASDLSLPANSVLEGHIDQVEASENKSDATVVVTFDKARLKNGEEKPIKATIIAIAQPASMQSYAGDAMAPNSGGAPVSGSGNSSGNRSGATSPSGNNSTPQRADSTDTSSQVPADNRPSTQHPNGVPGVMLKSDLHEHTSATFTAKGKNVHLPDGTQMEVAVAVIPAGATVQ